MLLEELLASTASADPDLRVRILIALAMSAAVTDEPTRAIALLEEARTIGADLDDRRRATLLYSLAQSYRMAGDLEGAVRSGTESLALWKAIDSRAEAAGIENELSLIYLDLGNLTEAERHLAAGRADMASVGDDFRMAHLADTEARIALERGDVDEARRLANAAVELSERTGQQPRAAVLAADRRSRRPPSRRRRQGFGDARGRRRDGRGGAARAPP